MTPGPKQRRAARHAQRQTTARPSTEPRAPITDERITDAALQVVATEGYDALTIRSISNALGTGPSSLYAHIVNKTDIDDLLIGRLSSRIALPKPDPAQWPEQLRNVLAQVRDQYLKYPGIARAALATVPTHLETLRVSEGVFAILLAGGIEPQVAAWAMDVLFLYVAGYTLEASLVQRRKKDQDAPWVLNRDELVRRFTALPENRFPLIRRYAAELTSGTGHERFDFALSLFIDTVTNHSAKSARASARGMEPAESLPWRR
jgi:AcrR family transcriptional regulator